MSPVKERPILFQGAMIRAILAGTKTQTRRVVKAHVWDVRDGQPKSAIAGHDPVCPYGRPGDRLWVRETWGFNPDFPGHLGHVCYRADPGHEHDGIKWRPSIHMPRAASRITLEITGVRVERLQDISEADAKAEGVQSSVHLPCGRFANENFAHLWEQINGDGSWAANPWVWVVEFRRIEP